ncbi:hypothetical protein TUM12370_29730 [Salmonella enterica subsp. enterica serovar Choleraesuis]|nr:hypothetical protein TUM12370_29730 [Salmonella enterica subsp. enterica serovar Choleraesuis]
MFITIHIAAKYSVYIDPQVITANGAHPRSVIDNDTPVDSTNLFNAGAKAPVNNVITAPIPVSAIAIRIPPSRAFDILTRNNNDSRVMIKNIIAGAPREINDEKYEFSCESI